MKTMYRIDRMRRDYERFTAAEGYSIGFPVGDDIYAIEMTKIPRRFTRVQKETSGGYGLYVKIGAKDAKKLAPKATKVGTMADLIDSEGHINEKGERVFWNKGVMFEKLIWERNGMEFRGKDKIPFYESGDITIDGKEIQVKYRHARICYDKTLTRLKKGA